MARTETAEERVRRKGRAMGIAVFAALVTTFTAVCSGEILLQVWAPPIATNPPDCAPGIQRLIEAVDRARQEASEETGGERAAVARFRKALLPEWNQRPGLTERCRGNRALEHGLRLVDWLRYAEEHAARYEAVDLAKLRRQVNGLAAKLKESTK